MAFVGEVMTFVIELAGNPGESLFPDGTLTDVKVDADTATGSLAGEELGFIREDGRWYLTGEIFD